MCSVRQVRLRHGTLLLSNPHLLTKHLDSESRTEVLPSPVIIASWKLGNPETLTAHTIRLVQIVKSKSCFHSAKQYVTLEIRREFKSVQRSSRIHLFNSNRRPSSSLQLERTFLSVTREKRKDQRQNVQFRLVLLLYLLISEQWFWFDRLHQPYGKGDVFRRQQTMQ